jgi:DNA-binding NarL/FixJ family response regulator
VRAADGIPVVILSGSDPIHLEQTAVRLGAAAALAKPARLDDLAGALHSVVGGCSGLPAAAVGWSHRTEEGSTWRAH